MSSIRSSKRLSNKRAREDPDSTSPVKKICNKSGTGYVSGDSSKDKEGKEDPDPQATASIDFSSEHTVGNKVVWVKLVDIMTTDKVKVAEEVSDEIRVQDEQSLKKIKKVKEELVAEDSDTHALLSDALIKDIEGSPQQERDNDQIFSVVGAVVAEDLVNEMSLDNADWIKGTERECNVRMERDKHLVIFGSIQQISDTQLHLQQHLLSVREEKQRREEMLRLIEVAAAETAAAEAAAAAAAKEADKFAELVKPGRSLKAKLNADMFACGLCCGQFVSEEALSNHVIYHEEKNDPSEMTHDLSQFYDAVESSASEASVKLATCSKCGWKGSLTEYIQHVYKCKRNHACNICPASFTTALKLKRHFATHFDDHGNLLAERVEETDREEEQQQDEKETEATEELQFVVISEAGDGTVKMERADGEKEPDGAAVPEGHVTSADMVINALMELQASIPSDADKSEALSADVAPDERQLVTEVAASSEPNPGSSNNWGLLHECPLCDKTFVDINALTLHYQEHFDASGSVTRSSVTKAVEEEEIKTLEQLNAVNPGEVPEQYLLKADAIPLRCRVCSFISLKESTMHDHVTSTHLKVTQKPKVKCCICDKQFNSDKILSRHMSLAHGQEKGQKDKELEELFEKYICEVNPFDPESIQEMMVTDYKDPALSESVKINSSEDGKIEKEGECPDCGYKGSKFAVYKHRMRHHKEARYPCHICKKAFSLQTDLTLHLQNIHSKTEGSADKKAEKDAQKRFMCRLCGYRGITVFAVRMHIQRMHKPGGHQCAECDKSFPTKIALRRHAKCHLTDEEVKQQIERRKRFSEKRQWMCPHCPYVTPHSETDLKEHISRKHEDPKLKCEYCGKMFAVKYDLQDHINHMHLKLKRVVCDLCGLEMHHKNLKTHMRRVHEKLKPYQCSLCHRAFLDQRNLNKHMQRHQPKEKRASTVYCKICSKAYVSQKNLDDHMNVHRGMKPYKCDHCDTRFSGKLMYQRHMRNHVRGMLKCPVANCNRQVDSEALLNKHMVKKHRETAKFQCSQCLALFAIRSAVEKHRCNPNEAQSISVQPPVEGVAIAEEFSAETNNFFIIEQEQIDPSKQLIVAEQSEDMTIADIKPVALMQKEEEGEVEEAKVYMCSICQAVFTSMEETAAHIGTHVENTEQANENVFEVHNAVDSSVQEGMLVEQEGNIFTVTYAESENLPVQETAETVTDITGLLQQ